MRVGRVIDIANTRSKTVPRGFNQEETFKAIWSASTKQKPAR